MIKRRCPSGLRVRIANPLFRSSNLLLCSKCRVGGIGRHTALKMRRLVRAGSSPASGTSLFLYFWKFKMLLPSYVWISLFGGLGWLAASFWDDWQIHTKRKPMPVKHTYNYCSSGNWLMYVLVSIPGINLLVLAFVVWALCSKVTK